MAKYYVQSGTLRTIIQAESTQKAAVWAVHQVLGQVLELESAPSSTIETDADGYHKMDDRAPRVAVLGPTVCVSEQGFDRRDAKSLDTLNVVSQWNDLVSTLDRLEKMLYRVAA